MTETSFDVAVVGGGAVGLATALAFADEDFRVCLIGPQAARRDGRTAALLDTSLQLMARLGLARELTAVSAPLRAMRIVDDTGSLFRPPPVTFEAAEIDLPAFGRNVENATLVDLLARALRHRATIVRHDGVAAGLEGVAFDRVRLADGGAVSARLVVAADGRKSALRSAAALPAKTWAYPQAAVTTILAHEREHDGVSTEFHTRGGPFTLVPLPGRRSSLVWVTDRRHARALTDLDDARFAEEVMRRSHGLLGHVRIDGPRGIVPLGGLSVGRLVAGRLALVGEAAHVLPPIGAQGLNIGLKDVAVLSAVAVAARSAGRDIGSPEVLARYERERRSDINVRTAAVDGLNRSLLSGSLGLDALRGIGLGALARIGPLRRAVMRAGLMSGEPRVGRTVARAAARPFPSAG